MKVLIMSNIPSPYRVNFYNELGKKCELTVLFELPSSSERDESWKEFRFEHFNGVILKGVRTGMDSALCPGILRYLKKNVYDVVAVGGVASLTPQLAVTWLHIRGIPYLYEGDGGIAGKKTGWKAYLKRRIFSKAKICMSTTKDFDQYCLAYGASGESIRRYPFTSVYERDIMRELPGEDEKKALREELGIAAEHMIVSVGRFVEIKGFDILIKAASGLPKGWEVFIIGGKSEVHFDRVHFVEFQKWDTLKKYYCAADYFVLPTRYDPWGLVVNEAMACGLPVVTTYRCGAGTELVAEGKNGYLYEPEEVETLQRYMRELCADAGLRRRMGQEALLKARDYTIEKMVDRYLEIFGEFT